MVLEPLTKDELCKIFDTTSVQVLKYYIQKALFSQPEILIGQKKLSIQIPKEHIEQWIVQAIGGIPVGAGNYPIDVIKEDQFGADIKMLNCKVNDKGLLCSSSSNESSLLQNFKDTGSELDILFERKNYAKITEGWKGMLFEKLSKAMTENNISQLYYIFILKGNTTFYICGFSINIGSIKNIGFGKTSNTQVSLSNFIDDKLGNVKIYKAKKRLELRLYPKYLVDSNFTIPINIEYKPRIINMRDIIKNNCLLDYKDKIVNEIFV